jgi:23S rRNA-/tRNA-specific pseudouridylate synthase
MRHSLLLLSVMEIPLHRFCRIVKTHPCGLYAVEKAAGILSHPNREGERKKSLMDLPYDLEKEMFNDDGRCWYLLNRLDGPTSGLILLADGIELANIVKAAFVEHRVGKMYFALVKGIPGRRQDRWRDCLVTRRKNGALRTQVARGSVNAETKMQLTDRSGQPPARSLLSLEPLSGKTHQLRVQCAHRHLPIIGDATYGDFRFNREFQKRTGAGRLFLHSSKIGLEVTVSGKKVEFSAESPLPEAFTIALG